MDDSVFSSGSSTDVSLSIMPANVAAGASIVVSCMLNDGNDEDLLLIKPPFTDDACTADCRLISNPDCNPNYLPQNCTCDQNNPTEDGYCPDATKVISYTLPRVTLEMSGEWKCYTYYRDAVDYFALYVYSKLCIYVTCL